jgi:hypothetical protein
MLAERNFNVVLVGKNKGVGMQPTTVADNVAAYSGKRIVVRL